MPAPAARQGGDPEVHRLDLRLVGPALVVWGAAAAAPSARPVVLGGVAVTAVAVAVGLLGLRRAGPAALALVLVGAVCASVLATQVARGRGQLEPLAAQRAVAVVEGGATTDAHRVRPDPARPWADRSPRWVVRLHADRVTGRGRTTAADAEVLVLGGPAWEGVRRGDRVVARGRLEATEPADPASAVLAPLGAPATSPPTGRWARWGQELRSGLVRACASLPPDARGLLPGLVVGDTTALPPDLDAAMRATGLTHLTAVSGGNTALVTSAVLVLMTALGAGRRTRLLLAGAALLAFAALAGSEPSVLRAAVMGAAVLLGTGVSRGGAGVPALAAAVTALLVLDPWLARAAGFALSVLATGALLVFVPAWSERLARRVRRLGRLGPLSRHRRRASPRGPSGRLGRALAAALVVPIAAQAVCAPVLLLLVPDVPLLAVPANLLAAPAVAPATLLGLAAVVLEPLWPAGAGAAARLGGLGAQWLALVARTGAAVPGAQLPWPQGPLPALGLAALVVGLALAPRALRRCLR
ncbi:ComEC/Rec2 family competence protein [Quadrisphaera sp. INWT6]|uniref:ComEC/Rec2 family competence protein n=1 Tax=Quadrisphaera sp. INWT6 TaxID=2596917 RepID=UPI0018927F4D|nr:ComEC/Rec2 family competence protein [Quadrisphaera sp. INWT6]